MPLKAKFLLPVLLALAFLSLVSLQALFLVMTWLGLSIGGDFEGWNALSWLLAAGTTVLSVVLVLFRPRWIAWCVLALTYALSAAIIAGQSRQSAQALRESNERYAPARLAENQLLLENALIKADCADGVTLTLNRKEFSDGDIVMSVSAIPMNRTHQRDLVVVLSNGNIRSAEFIVRNLSRSRPDLEAYKSRGSYSCQLKIDAMLKQLDSFAWSEMQPRKG